MTNVKIIEHITGIKCFQGLIDWSSNVAEVKYNPLIVDFGQSVRSSSAVLSVSKQACLSTNDDSYIAPEVKCIGASLSFSSNVYSPAKMFHFLSQCCPDFEVPKLTSKCLSKNPMERPSLH